MATFIVLDGYNVLHKWEKTRYILSENLSQARDFLTEATSNYLGYTEETGVIVFDGTDGLHDEVSQWGNLEVVFSKQGETADSYIEKRVKALREQGEVYVVTDDGPLQNMVLTYGCYRMTVREFVEKLSQVDREIDKAKPVNHNRNTLDERVSEEVRMKLEAMRRKKDRE